MSRTVIGKDDPEYNPKSYRLVQDLESALTLDALRRRLPGLPNLATGLYWNREEFLQEPWIAEYIEEREEGVEFRDDVLRRYGSRIPAAFVTLDYGAECFDAKGLIVPIITANSTLGCVTVEHVRGFAQQDDARKALHLLFERGLLFPLTGAEILAPCLSLERVTAGA